MAAAAIAAAEEPEQNGAIFMVVFLACELLLLLRQFPLLRFLRKLNCLLGVSSRIMKHGFHFR